MLGGVDFGEHGGGEVLPRCKVPAQGLEDISVGPTASLSNKAGGRRIVQSRSLSWTIRSMRRMSSYMVRPSRLINGPMTSVPRSPPSGWASGFTADDVTTIRRRLPALCMVSTIWRALAEYRVIGPRL
jgi:hypothetical protein